MDPLTAGIFVGGQALAGAMTPDAPSNYTGLQSQAQYNLMEQMARMAAAGGGDFGFGQAARQGNATLQSALAQRGINPNSGVGISALAQMLANATAQDAQGRRNFGLQAASLRVPTINYQKLGKGWDGTSFGGSDSVYRGTADFSFGGQSPVRDQDYWRRRNGMGQDLSGYEG